MSKKVRVISSVGALFLSAILLTSCGMPSGLAGLEAGKISQAP